MKNVSNSTYELYPIVAIVPGSGHSPKHVDVVAADLTAMGYPTITPDIGSSDKDADFSVCGANLAAAIEAERAKEGNTFRDVIAVLQSRAGNYGPWAAQTGQIDHMIFVGASFEEATLKPLLDPGVLPAPPRNTTPDFENVFEIALEGEPLFEIRREMYGKVFAQECSLEVQEEAADHLVATRRTADEPELAAWPPNVSADYIICEHDLAVSPAWSEYICKHVLHITPTYLKSDHSPFLSHSQEFVNTVVELADKRPRTRTVTVRQMSMLSTGFPFAFTPLQ